MNIYLQKKQKRWNSVTITMLVAALLVGYLLWFFVPMYWPVFRMTGIMKSTCNEALKTRDKDKLMKHLLKESRRTKLKLSEDNFRISFTEFSQEELIAASDKAQRQEYLRKRGKECIIEFYYEDDYAWPLIGKTMRKDFSRELVEPLEAVTWKKTEYDCSCVGVR